MNKRINGRRSDGSYWWGRPKVDDDGNEIPEPPQDVIRDENGVPTDLQEITGYESNDYVNAAPDRALAQYSDEWNTIARDVKNERRWRCEMCGFTSPGSAAIQLHHIDHDKADNRVASRPCKIGF